uniref:trafficking protein particle complex subunit 13-like n=1 Tax=Styela clava TaxID=7725 RepID=UPI001939405C|nr:trafficking protein particle complex subunit 13-like [Styela clava]
MDKEHILALRVMRLTKPSMLMPISLSHVEDTNSSNKIGDLGSGLCTEQLLSLPQSFGNIFLGETFVSYISVHNDSTQEATDVVVKADLQTGSQRISLTQPASRDVLSPENSIDDVMRHEVKELGTHILVCSVSYKNAGVQNFFRKFFKFQVLKPLDVKTKFYNTEPHEVFLEAQIQNITNSAMCIEKVSFEPSSLYTTMPLNTIDDQSTYESQPYLKPKDTRQYLYQLIMKPGSISKAFDKAPSAIGKLDIVWKTALGERGRLQTSQLQRPPISHSDIRIDVKSVPSEVVAMDSFKMSCQVTNCSERPKNLSVSFKNQTNILWKGISGFNLRKLEPKCSTSVDFDLLPITPGLLGVSGLRITDIEIDRTYEFDYIHHILVHAVAK